MRNVFVSTRTAEQRTAIRFLAGYRAALVRAAGPEFTWRDETGVIGGAQAGEHPKYGNARNGYRVIVWERQGGLCATCGESMSVGEFDVAHYVSNMGSKGKNGGYVNFNVMGAHPWCNILDAEIHGAVIPPSALAHPEFLMHSSPNRRECLEADARSRADESRTMAAYRVAHMARIAELLAEDEG